MKPRFCVVRDPLYRLYSEVKFQAAHPGYKLTMSVEKLKYKIDSLYSLPYHEIDAELLHLLPQNKFIWNSKCDIQCDCVINFDKLHIQCYKLNVFEKKFTLEEKSYIKSMWHSNVYKNDIKLYKHVSSLKLAKCWRPTRDFCVHMRQKQK